MFLRGKVQTAQISNFNDLEITVVDRDAVRPAGGRPQYTCRLVSGWTGVDELRQLKNQLKKREATDADAEALRQQLVPSLPQEDQVLELAVLDIGGKNGFTRLICQVVNVLAP